MLHHKSIKLIKLVLDTLLAIQGVLAGLFVILLTGFYLSDYLFDTLTWAVEVIIILFALQEIARVILLRKQKIYLKKRWFEIVLAVSILLNEIFQRPLLWAVHNLFAHLTPHDITVIYLIISLFIMIAALVVKALRYNHLIRKLNLHPSAIFALSFGIIIIIGTLLLSMPRATVEGSHFSLIDSLFTSSSAVCVTGLIVVDTATNFTILGKLIILFLIQIGGLGVMTITTFFALFFGSGLSYRFRIVMGDLLSTESMNEISSLLKKIALFTIFIELFGAVQLYVSIPGDIFPINQEKLFNSIFHSVSAFCNAGFSLYSNNLMDSSISGNHWFNFNILILIILGGIGFPVLNNLYINLPAGNRNRNFISRLNINTKLVLSSTIILLLSGTVLIYLTGIGSDIIGNNFWTDIYNSFFLSVSSRTAGFNNSLIQNLSTPTLIIIIGLMWIGASPGSTGGGIKTTTFAIAYLYFVNYIRGKDKLNIHYRNIDILTIRKAFLIIFSSIIALFISIFILVWIEPDKSLLNIMFEATSAMSTVGLSMDTTFHLGTGGKWIIVLLMFIGRIGILSFLLAFFKPKHEPYMAYPKENIIM